MVVVVPRDIDRGGKGLLYNFSTDIYKIEILQVDDHGFGLVAGGKDSIQEGWMGGGVDSVLGRGQQSRCHRCHHSPHFAVANRKEMTCYGLDFSGPLGQTKP